jgi:hypothetical protein
LCSERDSDTEETGARPWDAQSRNGKGVLCDEVKPDAGEVKPPRRSKRRRVRLRLCTYQRFDFDAPFTKSFNLVTSNVPMTSPSLRMRDVRLQTPPGEPSSPSVPKTTKNDKVTKKTLKKKAATSIKQLKAKVVKGESEEGVTIFRRSSRRTLRRAVPLLYP